MSAITFQGPDDPLPFCAWLRDQGLPLVLLDRQGADDGRRPGESWRGCPRLAIEPRPWLRIPAGRPSEARDALVRVERRWAERRSGGPGGGAIVLALDYDALASPGAAGDARPGPAGVPALLALEVDRSVRRAGPGRWIGEGAPRDPWLARLSRDGRWPERHFAPTPLAGSPPRTSLPREDYRRAVRRILEHLHEGDIYQANLCQMISAPFEGDPLAAWAAARGGAPPPRSAFVAIEDLALASLSPETFLVADLSGAVETWPIKGTRPRGADPVEDRRLAEALLASDKDRAELVMIVDLERNDLGRVCRTGSIRADPLIALRSFPSVHHLVGCVRGRLRNDVGLAALVEATFPGGSITGAPKRRAREILAGLEPARRGMFTGCLFWLGDDGVLDSSILIRTAQFAEGRVHVGAGGGVVVDSAPDAEWRESNHKAAVWCRALGFQPEEAR